MKSSQKDTIFGGSCTFNFRRFKNQQWLFFWNNIFLRFCLTAIGTQWAVKQTFYYSGRQNLLRKKKEGFHASLFRRHPIQWVFGLFLGKNKFSGTCIGKMRAVCHSFCRKSSCLGCEHEKVCISISDSGLTAASQLFIQLLFRKMLLLLLAKAITNNILFFITCFYLRIWILEIYPARSASYGCIRASLVMV